MGVSTAVRRLAALGMLDPRRLAAGAAALPWLVGRGASLGLLSQIHAASRPLRPAVVDRSGTLTWLELEVRANHLAGAWRGLGVRPGDQVAFLLRNGRELVEGLLAVQKAGVVAAPLNTWARARELSGILQRERPATLVYDTRTSEVLAGAVPAGTALLHVGPDAEALPGSRSYDDVLADGLALPRPPLARDRGSVRVLIHTSGTTGTPKAAARETGAGAAAPLLGVLATVPYRHDDVMYVANPLFHSLGLLTLGIGMATGATLVLPDAFGAEQALRDLAAHRVTAASFVPVMLRRMLEVDPRPDVDLTALRVVLVSGSALPAELRRRAAGLLGDVLYDLYGSTEAGWVSIATPETMRAAPDSVGRPVRGVELALLDPDGRPVAPGEQGEVHVRSAMVFAGYDSGEATRERDGWLSTGDVGRLDAAGLLHLAGRADDMVVVGGENVFPDEVEEVLASVDGVTEVAVVGVPDEEMGQVLAAFVVGDVDLDALRTHARQHLPSYKVPRHVHALDELPRNATGKVLRRELAALP